MVTRAGKTRENSGVTIKLSHSRLLIGSGLTSCKGLEIEDGKLFGTFKLSIFERSHL